MSSTAANPHLNLRVCHNSNEIIDTIGRMFADASPVMLWQNHGGKRVVVYATITSVDLKNRVIVFAAKDKFKFQIFSRQYNIYIRGSERSILFKQATCRFNAGRLAIPLPNEVRLLEKRRHPRLDLSKLKQNLEVFFNKRIGTGVGTQRLFEAHIVNLSNQGMCLEFFQDFGKYFYEGDCLLLSRIHRFNFTPAREATVIYIQKHTQRDDRIRLGIKLKEELSDSFLNNLTSHTT